MEMIPKVGLGEIRFGMSPAKVRAIFPEQETYEEWMGGNLNDALLYHGLILMFDKHDAFGPLSDSRLDEIIIKGRTDISFWGLRLLDWSRDDLVSHLDRIQTRCEWYGPTLLVPEYSVSATFTENGRLENFGASSSQMDGT